MVLGSIKNVISGSSNYSMKTDILSLSMIKEDMERASTNIIHVKTGKMSMRGSKIFSRSALISRSRIRERNYSFLVIPWVLGNPVYTYASMIKGLMD